ncbi:MAG: DUF485 domain-containing protein [Pseudomonadota bacterium]
MAKSAKEMLDSPDFKRLVSTRWKVSLTLLAACFITYYGYILLIAIDKPFLAQKIGTHTTLGIPIGVAVIVINWILTVIYVLWANNRYDNEVKRLKEQL